MSSEQKKIKFKYEVNDDLLVYEGNASYEEGSVVRVIDRSTDDPKTFLVISLKDIGEAKGDLGRMYGEFSRWVHQDDCKKIVYKRPTPWWQFWK